MSLLPKRSLDKPKESTASHILEDADNNDVVSNSSTDTVRLDSRNSSLASSRASTDLEERGKRGRRAAANVCYREPTLNK